MFELWKRCLNFDCLPVLSVGSGWICLQLCSLPWFRWLAIFQSCWSFECRSWIFLSLWRPWSQHPCTWSSKRCKVILNFNWMCPSEWLTLIVFQSVPQMVSDWYFSFQDRIQVVIPFLQLAIFICCLTVVMQPIQMRLSQFNWRERMDRLVVHRLNKPDWQTNRGNILSLSWIRSA
jgi:hypothetical protein